MGIQHKKAASTVKRVIVSMLVLASCAWSAQTSIHFSRSIDTVATGATMDTLSVRVNFFSEGAYDTVWESSITYDTTGKPADVLLAFDLSGSMDVTSGTPSRWRITWAQISALRFLDSLESSSGNRIGILGWTATADGTKLADTSDSSKFYQRWFHFSTDFDAARAFIRDSLFLDGNYSADTCNADTLVRRNAIPNGTFDDTPLNVATIVSLTYLANHADSNHTPALIMLTDGENDDDILPADAISFVDSMYAADSITLFAIGFQGGDSSHLAALAVAGAGQYFNATNPEELDSVYAGIARLVITEQVDTLVSRVPVIVNPDTLAKPIDVLLAFDLSGSMKSLDGSSRWRITWAQIAALTFLDSLKAYPESRVSILGWTNQNSGLNIADTSNHVEYRQEFMYLTDNLDSAKHFIKNYLFIDGDIRSIDIYNGDTLVRQDNRPSDRNYDDTPLNISTVVSMKYLSVMGSPDHKKAVVILADGANNDNFSNIQTIDIIDSMYRKENIALFTLGFKGIEGSNVNYLQSMAQTGGGEFYNAVSPEELETAFQNVLSAIITNVTARQLYIQEVLPIGSVFITGSDTIYDSTSVDIDSFTVTTNAIGNTVLRWYTQVVPIWSKIYVGYSVAVPAGTGLAMVGNLDATNPVYTSININKGIMIFETTASGDVDSVLYTGDTYVDIIPPLKIKPATLVLHGAHKLTAMQMRTSVIGTSIRVAYYLPKMSLVKLCVYNSAGREIETLMHQFQQRGQHTCTWNNTRLSRGVYYIKLFHNAMSPATNKIILVH